MHVLIMDYLKKTHKQHDYYCAHVSPNNAHAMPSLSPRYIMCQRPPIQTPPLETLHQNSQIQFIKLTYYSDSEFPILNFHTNFSH